MCEICKLKLIIAEQAEEIFDLKSQLQMVQPKPDSIPQSAHQISLDDLPHDLATKIRTKALEQGFPPEDIRIFSAQFS